MPTDQANCSPALTHSAKSDADALTQIVAERRKSLGIRPSESKPLDLASRYQHLASGITPEAIAAEQAEWAACKAGEARRRAQRLQAEAEAAVERCQAALNVRGGTQTLDSFTLSGQEQWQKPQGNVLKGLRKYAEAAADATQPLRNAILYGPCGTGKDHLAMGLLREVVKVRPLLSGAVLGQDLFAAIRKKIGGDRDESEVIQEFAAPDVLIVSDPLPPSGALTEWQAACLFRLVNTRYTRGRATWITINVRDGNEAVDRMGAATWDRLKHDAWVFRCSWPSHRRTHSVWGGGE